MMRQFMKPERIRIIAVLAIFNYIFLGSEYLFDNMIRYATDSAGVVRAQNYVLGISVIQIDGMRIGSGMGTNISGSFAGDKTQQHRVAIAADFGYAFASIMVNGTAIPLGGTTDNLEFEVAPADSYQIEVALTTNSSRNYNIVWAPSFTVAEQHGFGNDCVIEHGSVEIISAQLGDGTVVNAAELAGGNIADASTRMETLAMPNLKQAPK